MPQVSQSRYSPQLKIHGSYHSFVHGVHRDHRAVTTYQTSGGQDVNTWRHFHGVDEDDLLLQDSSGSHPAFIKKLVTQTKNQPGLTNQYDNGHEFKSVKYSIVYPDFGHMRRYYPNGDYVEYTGTLYPYISSPSYPPSEAPSDSKIIMDGTSAIRATIPVTPHAGVTRFLSELYRDGLPSVTGLIALKHGITSKTIGHEHLNAEFAIRPLESDIKGLATAVLKASKRLRQLDRDSGRVVRRKRQLYSDSYTTNRTVSVANVGYSVLGPESDWLGFKYDYFGPSSGYRLQTQDVYHNSCWFSGAYSYYLHEREDLISALKLYEFRANALLGTRFTFETIWNLTPWTWLVDWFSRIGSVISNAEALANDSLVLRYGYIMHESRAERIYTLDQLYPVNSGSVVPSRIQAFYTRIEKRRTRATPYGFGLDLNALSPRRWAILGALGMTKAPTSLKGF